MSLGTWRENLKDAIVADTDDLPEFTADTVVLLQGASESPQQIDQAIARAVAKSRGIAALLYEGEETADTDTTDTANTWTAEEYLELYLDPIKRDPFRDPQLRTELALRKSLRDWLQGRQLAPWNRHHLTAIRVASITRIIDESYHVLRYRLLHRIT